tara:strand:- start:707 stop:874 length:168 start_codon:yes stop_codon:yes gene_type:complete
MDEQEIKLINSSIQAYSNMINFFKIQILKLERKKLKKFNKNCPECFKIINKREKQ